MVDRPRHRERKERDEQQRQDQADTHFGDLAPLSRGRHMPAPRIAATHPKDRSP
jgi:hypothetical protein